MKKLLTKKNIKNENKSNHNRLGQCFDKYDV